MPLRVLHLNGSDNLNRVTRVLREHRLPPRLSTFNVAHECYDKKSVYKTEVDKR